MLLYQTNPVWVQLFSYVNTFFCHVVVPNQSCVSSTLFLCKHFLLSCCCTKPILCEFNSFAVRFFFLGWVFFLLPRPFFSFCRESFSFCREVFLFGVSLFPFAETGFFFLPRGYSFCRESFSFCREVCFFVVRFIPVLRQLCPPLTPLLQLHIFKFLIK